jgi:hypothetical protein
VIVWVLVIDNQIDTGNKKNSKADDRCDHEENVHHGSIVMIVADENQPVGGGIYLFRDRHF